MKEKKKSSRSLGLLSFVGMSPPHMGRYEGHKRETKFSKRDSFSKTAADEASYVSFIFHRTNHFDSIIELTESPLFHYLFYIDISTRYRYFKHKK